MSNLIKTQTVKTMLENKTEEEREAIINIYHETKQKKLALAKELSKARSSIPKTLCDRQKQILEDHILDDNVDKVSKKVILITCLF